MICGLLMAVVLALAGCDGGHGPDSLFTRPTYSPAVLSDCLRCHSSAVDPGLDPLVTGGAGTAGKHDRHVSHLRLACERCHTGHYSSPAHMNGVFDTGNPAVLIVGFDAYNPTGNWFGDTGPGTGGCSALNCHGSDSPDWYDTGWVFPECRICHSNPIGLRRQVTGTAGDFASNPSITSRHVTGGADPVSGRCLVCHNLSTHATGTVLLRQADTDAIIIYSSLTPSTAEPFCLSCHDADGSQATFVTSGTPTSPFADGSVLGTAPYRMSAEIASQWTKSFGHRQQGLTCLGDGSDGTGCHGNGHGGSYVGILARQLRMPNSNSAWYRPADEPDYELCFSCHAGYPRVAKEAILGARQLGNYDIPGITPYYISSIQTLFRDRNYVSTQTRTYEDPTMFSGAYTNLHLYHVQSGPNTWRYRDTRLSSISCIACHSVHGSNTRWGWVHDSMLFSHFTGSGTEQYGMIGAPLASLGSYPTSCNLNCHNFFGTTHSWYDPSGE